MKLLYVVPQLRADTLIAVPKLAQAVFAALGDFYTWKLAESIYGDGSIASWTAVRYSAIRAFHTWD
jgi:GPI mannosyltransferase 3